MESIVNHLKLLRTQKPLVQNITNHVVMNNTANALLAVGASPIMSHAHNEVEDMVKIISSLVINIGTLDEYWVDSMLLASKKANEAAKPWLLDPVGAGATSYRNEVLTRLLSFYPSVIRGNASEILALSKENIVSKGVDSTHQSEQALNAAMALSLQNRCIVCVSGETDFVVSGNTYTSILNGHPMMASVTGMGCTASALIGAVLAVEKDPFKATVSGMAIMGIAGEMAGEKSNGPGTFQVNFYDSLYQLEPGIIEKRVKIQKER
ncbi:MAG: hydroxyethylthiazole kinase [Cyclobacteriaceae bacterium]